ncbi:MAG: protein TonB [Marinoscillum sp.]
MKEIFEKLAETEEVIPFDDFPIDEPAPEVVEEVKDIVENMPTFPGGMSEFYKYVSENLEYPNKARSMGVSGPVYIQFIIDTDGTLIEVKSIKGIGMGCDEKAVRVLSNSPKWNPGKQRGREVKVRMILPVQFALQ